MLRSLAFDRVKNAADCATTSKMLLKTLLILLLAAAQGDGPAEDAAPKPVQSRAIIRTVPADSFEKVVHLLEKNKLKQADVLLDKRIEFLKNARANNWEVQDGEPPLLQSLLLSSRLKIALGDYEGVMSVFDYITGEIGFSHPTILARTIANQTVRAHRDPELFKQKLVKMAQMTWMFRVFQQPPEQDS